MPTSCMGSMLHSCEACWQYSIHAKKIFRFQQGESLSYMYCETQVMSHRPVHHMIHVKLTMPQTPEARISAAPRGWRGGQGQGVKGWACSH